MRKSFRIILKENEDLDKPLFGDKEGKTSDEPFGDEDESEMEVSEPEQSQQDPSFKFEIKGNFDFNELEKIVEANDVGLEAAKFVVVIDTKGNVSDSDHEKFVTYIEEKMKFFQFEE